MKATVDIPGPFLAIPLLVFGGLIAIILALVL
jgi:hypothetical protein